MDMDIKQKSKCVNSYSEDVDSVMVADGVTLPYSQTDKDYGNAFDVFFKNTVTGCESTSCELMSKDCAGKLPGRHQIYIDENSGNLIVERDVARGFEEEHCIKCMESGSNQQIQKNFKIMQSDQCVLSPLEAGRIY